jgi:Zn-dependent protease/predicted transcriptional regulator
MTTHAEARPAPGVATRGGRPQPERTTRVDIPSEAGIRLGRIAGIELRIDWSLLFIFFLIAFNLGAGLFAVAHPDWSPALRWALAIVTAVLFFGSILLHELAHAVVGRAQGVNVDGITLFMFGGVARMRSEPPSPRAEFLMAAVGPLTSLIIGIVSMLLARALAGDAPVGDALSGARALSPAATALMWLGSINIALAIFNIIPGFPLDGGRLLRAVLWAGTGDFKRATRWASAVGRAFALFLITCGLLMAAFGLRVPFFGTGLFQGLWLVLIGWFLYGAAVTSYHQVVIFDLLRDVPVARLMRNDPVTVPPYLSLRELVDQYLMRSEERCLPVMDQGNWLGLVCVPALRKVEPNRWETTSVADVMIDASALPTVKPGDDVAEALQKLSSSELDQLPVVQEARIVGVLRRADILRFLQLQGSALPA